MFVFPLSLFAQESTDTIAPQKVEVEYERPAFETSSLIDTQTDRVYSKGTFEFVMNHRFGLVNDNNNDMIGIWGPTNIRLALSYAITDRITVGFGTTKEYRLQDFNLKVALLKQTKDGKMPFNLTYYGNWTVNATPKENFYYTSDRWSFFNQLILTRRMDKNFSFLISPSYSHFNRVERDPNIEDMKRDFTNDMLAVSAGGRVKIIPDLAFIVEAGTSLINYDNNSPEPGFGLGMEYSAVQHAFQLFISNYKGIVNQQNYMYNQNEFFNGEFMIGFNIMKSW